MGHRHQESHVHNVSYTGEYIRREKKAKSHKITSLMMETLPSLKASVQLRQPCTVVSGLIFTPSKGVVAGVNVSWHVVAVVLHSRQWPGRDCYSTEDCVLL